MLRYLFPRSYLGRMKMLRQALIGFSVCALALVLGGHSAPAVWNSQGLAGAQDPHSLIVSIKKHKHDDDDDDDDDDHHKKKKQGSNSDDGLTQCTIVKSGGMGCVAPQKLVCRKMKNNQKCCGCVGDKAAPKPMDFYECKAAVLPQSVAGRSISSREPDEATARTKFLATVAEEKLTLNGPVTCTNLGPGK